MAGIWALLSTDRIRPRGEWGQGTSVPRKPLNDRQASLGRTEAFRKLPSLSRRYEVGFLLQREKRSPEARRKGA